MIRQRRDGTKKKLSAQVREHANGKVEKEQEQGGNFSKVISTGSTLLDLAISGGRVHGGGLPGGIFVEIYGPESTGKTALICEISGDIQRKGGEVQFHDPEGRIDNQFAQMFGAKIDEKNYHQPDKVPEVFTPIRSWKPEGNAIHGIMVDSLAALSTDMEMDSEEGDKYGGRRAKEFSQELRKTCRIIKQQNYLLVCSNQIRDNFALLGPRHESPGGQAIRFYSSLRLETSFPPKESKIVRKKTIHDKEVSRVVGVNIEVKVVKSSIWSPLHTTPVTILFNYGIDDVKQNLQFLKDYTKSTTYVLNGEKVAVSMDDAIRIIEKDNAEHQLREEVITLWEEIESKFESERKAKR